jgi:transposase
VLDGDNALKKKLSGVLPFLDEKQRRILIASEAKVLGRGGIEFLSEITGMSRPTIRRGMKELSSKSSGVGIRKTGGGRTKITNKEKNLKKDLEKLIEPTTRGDPESPLRWTCKSVRNLAESLRQNGIKISHQSVANILHEMEYSLQGNRKTKEGKSHPDRDQQFNYINSTVKKSLKYHHPVVSVDTKKKELIGNFKNAGQEWKSKGKGDQVKSHDFPDPKVPKAIPYGVYDIGLNHGWVNVGITADTAEFAVESIRYWWKSKIRRKIYSKSRKLLICADSGGSNGYRSRLWKAELQKLSNEENIIITVCHFPPGTSKWNKIEHRLFSFITMNWRGKPLKSYQTIISLIASTKTKTGLQVEVRLDKKIYQKGIKIPKEIFEALNIIRHSFHGEWNYSIKPNN